MNFKLTTVTLLALLGLSSAFFTAAPFTSKAGSSVALNTYVPDGLTPEEYKRIKHEANKLKNKDLGRVGPRGFKSRSMQEWQKGFERGEVGHTFAPIDYKKLVKQGRMRPEDVPYMLRGGSWDNSDVRGAKRVKWSKKDKEYVRGGYKKSSRFPFLALDLVSIGRALRILWAS